MSVYLLIGINDYINRIYVLHGDSKRNDETLCDAESTEATPLLSSSGRLLFLRAEKAESWLNIFTVVFHFLVALYSV